MIIELNEQFYKALQVMESDRNVFITGKAGTGKSTLLSYFRTHTGKKIVTLAPTGVAALNIQGETIHSFFGFKPDISPGKVRKVKKRKKVYQNLDAIIIDEISMVRADLLDCVDKFMRLNGPDSKKPFGGTQLIFIGDLYQLPPVVTNREREMFKLKYESPYFFSADVFAKLGMEYIELEKVYRQKDELFKDLLNAVRNNSITDRDLRLLNSRVGQDLSCREKNGYEVHLVTTNLMADIINDEYLSKLKTKIYVSQAEINGDFKRESYPTYQELKYANGAQVMLLNNDNRGRWVNGSIGRVKEIRGPGRMDEVTIIVELSSGELVEVEPFTWEIFHFDYDEKAKLIESKIVGSFTQYPLKLAWAITIHKSQGKTFEKVTIDMGNGAFAHGQTYVALSRCTSLEGIALKKPILRSHIIMDRKIVDFLTSYQYLLSEMEMSLADKLNLIRKAIDKEQWLEILYLKSSDIKSRRVIRPREVGERLYQDKSFIGVDAYCLDRGGNRTFRVDRILEMKIVDKATANTATH
ncbi:MAG: AAA family ATPase [bacterium]|nr:AAA family ATPase [bacterium]